MTAAVLTPELVLVDPELAKAQRQTTNGKAAMSSTEPANGMFFVDQAQPAAEPEAQISPLTPPAPAEQPLAPPEPAPEPLAQPAPPPVAEPAPPAPPPVAAEAAMPQATPMVDVPLGTLIFRAGLLAEEQLEDALQEGMRTGKRLGEVLIERGWIAEKDLGRMLAGQKGLPFVDVSAADAQPDALRALPEEKARLQVALPLRYEDGELVVAVADPSNELVIENLRRALGSEPKLVVAPYGELLRAIGEAYAGLSAAPQQPAPQPEAVAVTEQPVQVEPAPAPVAPPVPEAPAPAPAEVPAAPAPELQVAPAPEPQPEPVQPLASPSPAVTPLPTVVPPAEERAATEPAVVPLQAPAAEAAPPVVAEAPPPVAEPAQPPAQPEAPAPLAPPEAPAVPAAVVEPQPVAPPAPEPPVQSQPAPSPEPPQEAAPAATHHVLLRLRDGETLQVGAFATSAEASAWAQDVVRQVAAAEGDSTWPFFANRFLRPDTIVSVDLAEESEEKWLGSSVRSRWAEAQS